ncbi:MAG: hypothetical protein IKT40_02025 [Bacilli bacterium]|nr:hypothetical protein [Bacilli bacterium]
MSFFRDLTDDIEGFKDFEKKRDDDDAKVKKYFDQCNHGDFVSSLLHLGSLLDTMGMYFDFINDQLEDARKMENKRSQKRKINKFIKDLNEKINLEYDFDKDTVIIEEIVLFNDKFFVFFDKSHFIKTIGLKEISYE